jgi:serine/threonine protein kinase
MFSQLLNFFLKDIGRGNLSKAPGADTVLHYLLEDSCFVLEMPMSYSYWVKLADYGAADSNPDTLGKPVTIDQFATLENSPIEFLLEGDSAEQSYAADTFSLGLCLFHLFTGRYV